MNVLIYLLKVQYLWP